MFIHPLPPYPNAPKPSGLTVGRTWFLHGVAGFTKEQIGVLTGVTSRGDILSLLIAARCSRYDPLEEWSRRPTTVRRVMADLGLPAPRDTSTGKVLRRRAALRRALRDAFVAGQMSWDAIDALPLPEEITERARMREEYARDVHAPVVADPDMDIVYEESLKKMKPPSDPTRTTPAAFLGRWRIVETELWAKDSLDLVVPAHITFDDESLGYFQMIAVEGSIDCRFDGPRVEFSWIGDDDTRPSNGRGVAEIAADGTLRGRLFFHQGDDSWFVARREGPARPYRPIHPPPRRRRR